MSEFEIGVLGAGAWGSALAVLWAKEGRRVALWGRDAGRVDEMRRSRVNGRLPGVVLPAGLAVVSAFPQAGVLVVCVPVQFLRGVLAAVGLAGAMVVCCKGVEAETLLLAPEVVGAFCNEVGVLSGPNFAHEVGLGLPAAAVLAMGDEGARAGLMGVLGSRALRLYGSGDVMGAAVGGAAKNVVAVAAGVVMGAGLGENARAALITRGVAEMGRLAVALGGRTETVSGLSGLGDLVLTCTGAGSRNFSLGVGLGKGLGLGEILAGRTGVTEAVASAPALLARAKAVGVEMPVVEAVVGLLEGRFGVGETVAGLMGRALRDE